MDIENVKNRIIELSEILKTHNYNYYVLSNPSISDFEYDVLLKELIELEIDFPGYAIGGLAVGAVSDREFSTILRSGIIRGRSRPVRTAPTSNSTT